MGNSGTKVDIPSSMHNTSASVADKPEAAKTEKKPCPACSACKETRKIRDACVFEKGEENCADLIEAHKQCLRDHGMKI